MAFVRSQLWLGLLVALGACGTPQATQTAVRPAVPGDPGSTVTPMAPPEPYTTPFPPPAPQLAAGAAKVLANPVVVPVFFGRDTLQAGLMTYAKAYLAGSSFAALREYGVGAGQLLSAVALPTPATAMDDTDVRALIEAGITDGTLPAPRPDGQSLYTLFFPVTTALTLSGSKSCVDFAGYHETFTTKSGATVVYAVIARCAKAQSLGSVAATTSHELTEAATDPLINGNHMLAPPYGLWVVATRGAEVADLCDPLVDAIASESGVGPVARVYSNEAAAAGDNPCVPAPTGVPSFGAVAILDEKIKVSLNSEVQDIESTAVAAGGSKTIEVRLRSSRDGFAFKVRAEEVPLTGRAGVLTLDFTEAPGQAQASGAAGGTLHLRLRAPAGTAAGYTTVRLTSSAPNGAATTETLWALAVRITG